MRVLLPLLLIFGFQAQAEWPAGRCELTRQVYDLTATDWVAAGLEEQVFVVMVVKDQCRLDANATRDLTACRKTLLENWTANGCAH